jgi:pilus assembly protein Flp/PilA
MNSLLTKIRNLACEEWGASLAEYGLLLALVAIVCIAGIALVGTNISTIFSNVTGSI